VGNNADGSLWLKTKMPWTASFYLTKNNYHFAKINIKVQAFTYNLTLERNDLLIEKGSTHIVNITSGNGGYTLSNTDPHITAQLVGDVSQTEGVSIELTANEMSHEYIPITI
jgi:hypothetical protein